jgi:diguanylate cyclase (GGDEF)-like protein/PAS domain S-box-containing protein
MNFESLAAFYAAFNFVAALITFLLLVFVSKKQGLVNGFTLILLLAACTFHSLTNGGMIISQSPAVTRILDNLRWFSMAAIAPLLLIFILDFTGRDHWLTPGWIVVFLAIPFITQIIVWTNSWHGLMIQEGFNEFIQIGQFHVVGRRIFGSWYWIYSFWMYLLIIFALIILINDVISTRQPGWRQFIWLIVGVFIPIAFSVVDTFQFIKPTWFKLLPFEFILMGLAFVIAITRGQFINVLPIARGLLMETLQDAVFMLDRNFRVVEINPIASVLIGKSKQEVLGQPAKNVLEHWPRLVSVFQNQNQLQTVAQIVTDKSGHIYDVHITPLRSRRRKSTGWVIVLHDITQLKEAEIRASRLATVIEQAHETVVITDTDGNITYANPYFEESTGFKVPEAIGKNPSILQSGKQDKKFYRELWETIMTGEAWSGNFINKRKDGTLYHEAATIFPIKTPEGEIESYAAVKRDITTQVEAERALQESESQYRLLADNATDVIWTMDLSGKFTYISPAIEQLRGYTPEEVLNQSLEEVFTTESLLVAQQALSDFNKMFLNEDTIQPLTLELEQKCKDGTTVLTESMISLILDKEQQELKLLGVTRNITERKQTELEIQQYARRQELLNELTHTAIQQTEFKQMLQILADRMGDLVGADGCYITLWDEQSQTAIPVAAYGPFRDTYQDQGNPEENEITLTESVLKLGRVIIIDDVFDSPYLSPRIAANFPTRSGIALPLIANNKKLGAALIGFNYKRKFTEDEVKISQQAAQQIALAVLKAQLLEEAKLRATEAETLRQASAVIVTTLEQEQAIERILEQLNQVVPYDSASVLLTHDLDMEIVGARGFENPDEILNLRFALTEETPNKVVFETRKPYILNDAKAEYPAFRRAPHNHIRGWMGIPLLLRDNLIGMLALDSQKPAKFNQDHARLASAFADQVVIALENARLFEETRRLAITDSLTNLFNRRHFMDLARREFERARRYKTPLSIIMLDIDFFKKINDTYGHLVGDQVLQTTAYICRKNLRTVDIMGRYGGEEFVIMLPETPLTRPPDQKIATRDLIPLPAQIVAERLRKTIAQESFEIGENSIKITISLGVAEFNTSDFSIENVIDHADQALLKAKNAGRNNVVIWNPEDNLG